MEAAPEGDAVMADRQGNVEWRAAANPTKNCDTELRTYSGAVRMLFRYLLLSGLLIGLGWGLFAVRIGERSLYSHLRSAEQGRITAIIADIKKDLQARLDRQTRAKTKTAEKKKKSTGKKRARQAKKDRDRKAEKLAKAAKVASRAPRSRNDPPEKTRTDEHISKQQEKSLDELLTARIRNRR